MAVKPLRSILVKPSGPDCNMACTYCFYSKKSSMFDTPGEKRMSDRVLESLLRQSMSDSGREIVFVWQGGEPTLVGLPFYRKVVDLQLRFGRNQVVGNALQTNGTLLDEDWIAFLRRYRFMVGISLDGPREVHDYYRQDKHGNRSWGRVAECATRLLESGVAVNALAVVNRHSQQFPEEIYTFFKGLRLAYLQLIPCLETTASEPSRPTDFSATAEGYGTFLCKIFDLWQDDIVNGQWSISIRFFDSLLHRYLGNEPPECSLSETCGDYLVVEHNGDVYPCDFHVQPEWKLGNLLQDSLLTLLHSEKQCRFGKLKAALPKRCGECLWLEICFGGCTRHRIPESNPLAASYFCEAYRQFFEHADASLRRIAEGFHPKKTN